MEKLPGLILSLLAVLVGTYAYTSGLGSALSAGIILAGIGSTLYFERRVIKETSTLTEKALSTALPVITELAIVGSIILNGVYVLEASIYLLPVLLLTDLLNRLDTLIDVNRSRLTGRISRVIILTLGIAASQINQYLLFYAIVAAGLLTVYDLIVLGDEFRSSI
jgi:hypothetical protein